MSVDHTAIQLALRAKLVSLSLATTGSIALSATPTGYARTTGSFYADGFWPGMELVASGFSNAANNGPGVITQVTPLALTVTRYAVTIVNGTTAVTYPATVAEGAASGRSLIVGLPSNRAWENVTYVPISNVPYIEEQYLPGPAAMESDGYAGLLELRPMYSPRIYVPSGSGISADGRYADAITRLFSPGTTIPVPPADSVTVRGDSATYRGQRAQAATPGWSCIPITIPLRCVTTTVPS